MKRQGKTTQVRQGDVFIEECAVLPADAQQVEPVAGRVILAAGEVTGHHHAMPSSDAAILAKGAERFLKVNRQSTLSHEEHGPIVLPGGTYEITIQREYDGEYMRPVVD